MILRNTYTYDSYGNVTSTEISNVSMASVNIKSSNEYTTDGNYRKSAKDAQNNAITFNYEPIKGLLNDVTDHNGNKVVYEYEPLTDRLKKAYSAQMAGIQSEYGYTGDDLTSITHNGFNYNFNYDKLGNIFDVSVAGQNLITNVYDLRKGLLNSSTYGNGHIKEYFYDSGDRLIEEKSNGESRLVYTYDAKGNLAQVGDRKIGLHIKYVYDFSGKLTNTYDSWGWNSYFDYDKAGKLTKTEENFENNKYVTRFEYGDFKNLTKVLFGTNSSVTYDYNENGENNTIGRLNSVSVKAGNTNVLTSKFFYQAGVQSYTSNRISLVDNNGNTIAYTYYPNGNIETITENGKIIKYYYDAVNQLTREDNAALNKTIAYEYDNGGNLQAKKEYDYTTETVISAEPTDEYKYTYDDIWKDKITSFKGKDITYDKIGNPLSYDGWNFTWDRGCELSSMVNTTSNQALSFTYNENGTRTTKTVNGVKTTYHLIGDAVAYEDNGIDKIYYTYGASNNLISMNLGGVEYYYVRNAQNDIIGLLDSNGNEVVRYTYDSWGKLENIDGSLKDTVGIKNPYRYRGYRYEPETGLYYLQSRYYNPEWGRFINADDTDVLFEDQDTLVENNLYAYCLNNPINMADDSGYIAWWIAAAIGGALFDTVAYMVGSAVSSQKITWAGVGKAALIGAVTGVTLGAVGKGVKALTTGAKAGTKIFSLSSKTVSKAVSSTKRLQHAFKHAKSFGFGNWNKTVFKQWECFIRGNLTHYTKKFTTKLGSDSVTGYYRYFNGQHVATYLYNSGPNKGLVASVVELSANQMTKFRLW